MRSRLRSLFRLQHFYILEATLISLFFVQGLRFLVGSLYSRISSAAIVTAHDPALITEQIEANVPGIVDPAVITGEIGLLGFLIGLPLLALLLGRTGWMTTIAAALVAAGRALMLLENAPVTPTVAASLVLGGGLLYIALIIRQRAQILPYFFILGIGIDQLLRAFGNTLDPSWSPDYWDVQVVLSVVTIVLSILIQIGTRRQRRSSSREYSDESRVSPNYGLLNFWGGIGLGAILFLELSLLTLPNAIAGRAKVDYTLFVPFVLAATLLPLVPWVRVQARSLISTFDRSVRGWVWMLLIALLLVIGTRVQGIPGGAALVVAQFAINMVWWWLVRPQTEHERNFTGLWLVGTTAVFALLTLSDFFTYEYAFVRNFAPEFAALNDVVPPLLRGFRGMGLAVLLLGAFLAVLPIVQTRRRIPWTGSRWIYSLLALVIVGGFSVAGAWFARPPVVEAVRNISSIRVGTYNLHSGFNEFFYYDIEAIARTIEQSGANVALLQEVEIGRMTSFGVDQTLWLARRLGMDVRFYPTNEGLQGLAILSSVEIVYDDGAPLTSTGNQTGLQRVQIRPDEGIITLYNTWLGPLLMDASRGRLLAEQEQDQQQQLDEIFALIGQHQPDGLLGRTVLGGTFNNVPDSPLIQGLSNTIFSDSFAGQPFELSLTVARIGLRARLDYLWIENMLRIGAGVMDSNASDHRMAVIEVQITR